MQKLTENIPSKEDYGIFREQLKKFQGTPYLNDEEYLLRHFRENPENTGQAYVEHRVKKLSSLYRTRVPENEQKQLIDIIKNPEFDERLETDKDGSYEAVLSLLGVNREKEGKPPTEVNHLSFATKYCHHCKPNMYPIYDAVNKEVLMTLSDCKEISRAKGYMKYLSYAECYKAVCRDYIIDLDKDNPDRDEGFYVDKYIQSIGIRILSEKGRETRFKELLIRSE